MRRENCSKCNGSEFAEATDFMAVKPLNKKFSSGANKIYTFCVTAGK